MNKKFALGRFAGIDVFIHWTFGILLAWIVYSNFKAGLDLAQVIWSVLFILAIFACVTLHEYGHALAARRYGIPTKDITLYPIGGVARLEKMPEKPIQELVVALAGPAVNIVIMLALYIVSGGAVLDLHEDDSSLIVQQSNFIPMLGFINIWLAFFNLIPAFPMDGGRVLRAFLSLKMERVKATEVAAAIGQILAIGFVFIGFYVNPFLIFIGIFIMFGAKAEAEAVKQLAGVSGFTAADAVMRNFQTLDVNQPIAEAVRALLDGQARSFLLSDAGTPCGYLSRELIIKGIREHGEEAPISAIGNMQIEKVQPDTPLQEVYQTFVTTGVPIVLVQDEGNILGVIDMENIAELMMVNNAINASKSN
jgi:Zn-dependent protease